MTGIILHQSIEHLLGASEEGERKRTLQLIATEGADRIFSGISTIKDWKFRSHNNLIQACINGKSESRAWKEDIEGVLYTDFLKRHVKVIKSKLLGYCGSNTFQNRSEDLTTKLLPQIKSWGQIVSEQLDTVRSELKELKLSDKQKNDTFDQLNDVLRELQSSFAQQQDVPDQMKELKNKVDEIQADIQKVVDLISALSVDSKKHTSSDKFLESTDNIKGKQPEENVSTQAPPVDPSEVSRPYSGSSVFTVQQLTSLNVGAANPCIQPFEKENVAPDGEGTFSPLFSMLLGPGSSGNRALQHGKEEPEMRPEVCLLSDLRRKDIVILAKQLDPDHINANWKSVGRKCSLPEEILKSIEDKRPISDTPAYQMLKSLPHIVPGLTIGKVVEKLEGSEMKQRHIAKCIRDSGLDLQLPFCSIGEDWIQKIAYCLMTDSKVIGSWEDLADSFEIPLPDVRLSRKDNALKRENGTHTELLISALIGMNSKMTMEDLARVLDELGRKHVADIVRGMISN